ncbi:MAG: hypothetical protein K0Q50_827 [Vampirovibrio sp.]|nr:hypothetical protein [Vampirovibrio sp.]
MRESITRQQKEVFQRDLGMGLVRFISSQDVWLALDDNEMDSRRLPGVSSGFLGHVSPAELKRYHRQLFYWLMLRKTGDAPWHHPLTRNWVGYL